jgi:hypothetical protein
LRSSPGSLTVPRRTSCRGSPSGIPCSIFRSVRSAPCCLTRICSLGICGSRRCPWCLVTSSDKRPFGQRVDARGRTGQLPCARAGSVSSGWRRSRSTIVEPMVLLSAGHTLLRARSVSAALWRDDRGLPSAKRPVSRLGARRAPERPWWGGTWLTESMRNSYL